MFELPVNRSPLPRLTRRQDPVVIRFREAAKRHGTPDCVVLDGAHLILDALHSRIPLDVVLTTADFLGQALPERDALWALVAESGATVYEVTSAVLAAASPVRTPTGIVALARWRPSPIEDLWTAAPALVIGLVDVQDPGNAGAAIRSADGLGASGVALLGASADPASPKVLRGAMGSSFRLPVARADLSAALTLARRHGSQVCAAVAPGTTTVDISNADLARPTLVLFGNEGAGLEPAVVAAADCQLSIAMRPGLNSFNVAVSAALVLYEARRQRLGSQR